LIYYLWVADYAMRNAGKLIVKLAAIRAGPTTPPQLEYLIYRCVGVHVLEEKNAPYSS
jgi:hypothetical protein